MFGRSSLVKGLAILLIVSVAAAQPPGGPFEPPKPGQVLPGFQQQMLKLSGEQKKQLDELQKDVDARLAKILTADQTKSLTKGPFGGRGMGGFGGPPPGGFGGPGFGGTFTGPNRLEDARKHIDAREEEWKVIGPKLQKIILTRQILTADARVADAGVAGPQGKDGKAAGSGDAPPAPGGFGGGMGTNAISQAQAELRAVLADPKPAPAEVQEKIAAVRKAREKARADLDAAQKDLLQMLTAQQAAILVSRGYIE